MLCQAMSNLRVRFRHISYGDQGLFIERDLFFKAGMFPDVPLMEDFQFALNLKRFGEPLGMTKHRIRTSARRFPDGEVNRLRVWVNMARLRSRYVKGASPEELALAYGQRSVSACGGSLRSRAAPIVISCRSSGTGRQGSTPRILAAARCTFHARRAPIDG